jgi:hypothetical protein
VDRAQLLDCDWSEIRYLRRAVREEPLYLLADGEILM